MEYGLFNAASLGFNHKYPHFTVASLITSPSFNFCIYKMEMLLFSFNIPGRISNTLLTVPCEEKVLHM